MTVGPAQMWYGFLGLEAPGHGVVKQQGSFTDFAHWVSPAASLTAVRAARSRAPESGQPERRVQCRKSLRFWQYYYAVKLSRHAKRKTCSVVIDLERGSGP